MARNGEQSAKNRICHVKRPKRLRSGRGKAGNIEKAYVDIDFNNNNNSTEVKRWMLAKMKKVVDYVNQYLKQHFKSIQNRFKRIRHCIASSGCKGYDIKVVEQWRKLPTSLHSFINNISIFIHQQYITVAEKSSQQFMISTCNFGCGDDQRSWIWHSKLQKVGFYDRKGEQCCAKKGYEGWYRVTAEEH